MIFNCEHNLLSARYNCTILFICFDTNVLLKGKEMVFRNSNHNIESLTILYKTEPFLMWGFHIISYCSLLPLLLKARIPEEHRYQVFKNFVKINRLVLTVMLADSQKNVWDDLQQGVNMEINPEFKKNFKIHSVLNGWTPGPGCCTSKITIQQISSRETNCVIHQIYIYPVDSVIHVLNNWVHLPLLLVSLFGTSVYS